MKPSVLEALTEEAIKRIEEHTDHILQYLEIPFEEDAAPVRRSVHKLQTVERIEKKLALIVEQSVIKTAPVVPDVTLVVSEEVPAEAPAEQAEEQAEAPTPNERPAKSKKSK